MARKVWFTRMAVFLAVIVLMLSASFGNIKILNTSAQAEAEAAPPVAEAEEETVQQAAEEAAPPVVEAEEETVQQMAEEAAPPVAEAEEETVQQVAEEAAPPVAEAEEEAAPGIESEPASVTEPEDHQEDMQPEAVIVDDNHEWIDDNERTVDPEEEEDLEVIEDDDAGTVSEEILESFSNPELYEQEAFVGTAKIRLMNEGMLSYGDEIILRADVRDVNVTYRLVWEANDNDGRGWFTVCSGEEYRFVLDRENAAREYRVAIFAVD